MNPNREVTELLAQLDDFRTRAAAMRRLRALGGRAAEAVLEALKAARSGPANRRWALVELAGAMEIGEAVPVLLDILREDASLRGDAARALQRITGRDIGPEPEDWAKALEMEPGEAEEPEAAGPSDRSDYLPAGNLDTVIEGADHSAEFAIVRNAFDGIAARMEWHAEEQYALVRIPLPKNRKQQMIIAFSDVNEAGNPVVTIYTECGPASPAAEQAAFRRNVTLKYGTFQIEQDEDGYPKVTMRQYLPRAGLNPEQLREATLLMARDADHFENDLTHADRI